MPTCPGCAIQLEVAWCPGLKFPGERGLRGSEEVLPPYFLFLFPPPLQLFLPLPFLPAWRAQGSVLLSLHKGPPLETQDIPGGAGAKGGGQGVTHRMS